LSNRSKAALITASGLAPGLSTLFTTTMGFRPRASAFLVTKRVCGIGPSGVDQQHHAVDHGQGALHLAAEVRVAGVSTMLMWCLPAHGAVLGQDGDAALAFDGVVVHHGVDHLLVLGKGAGLAQQLVDHGGFAMVNVGDDGDVANLRLMVFSG
jgi:hypothetical protein